MDDFALALKLQEEFDREAAQAASVSGVSTGGPGFPTGGDTDDSCYEVVPWEKRNELSLVDPQWEVLDPNPDIRALFLEFNDRFFWSRLSGIEVKWSPRMTLCAGLCVYEGRGGLCSVRLSLPLLKLRPRKDLIETLLHEMIHAYLFVTDNNKDHDGHGPEFHKHMYRLNKSTGTNISVYHTFHDEVESYRQHWWRCDGPCRSRPPYFGYVKRAMNRPPSARDPWWPRHQQTCDGTYTKVKEPEGYGQKNKKKKDEPKEPEKSKGAQDIRNLFGGKGVTLGGGSLAKPGTSSHSVSGPSDNKPGEAGRPDLPQLPFTDFVDFDPTLFVSDSDDDYSSWEIPQKDKNNEVNATSEQTNVKSSSGISKESDSSDKPYNSSSRSNNANNTSASKTISLSDKKQHDSKQDTDAVCKPGELANVRVRKLPAFGIITSERQGEFSSHQTYEQMSKDCRKEDTVEPSLAPSKTDINGRASPDMAGDSKYNRIKNDRTERDENKGKKTKGSTGLKRKGSLREWMKDDRTNHPPPGGKIRIPGFTSVSNKSSSPASLTAKKQDPGSPVARREPRKAENVPRNNFAADRNARAHRLSDSDNGTDDEESQPLSSAVKRQGNLSKSHDKKRHLSNSSDTVLAPNYKRTKTTGNHFSDDSLPRNDFTKNSVRQDSIPGEVPSVASTNQSGPSDPLQTCPVCQATVKASKINDHLDLCLS